MRIGVDAGGTFTDFVVLHDDGRLESFKLRSNPLSPAKVILAGLEQAAANQKKVDVVHGSTVATNALLERKGARTAFVTTAGFEDLLEIGRQNRPELYNLTPIPRRPLIPRNLCFGVHERTYHDGTVARRPTAAELKRLTARLKRAGVRSIAICFLHAYQNSANERAVITSIKIALKQTGVYVCASHDVSPEFREYERSSTTAVNAYVGPLMEAYLDELGRARRFQIAIMQSNGGCLSAGDASRHAVRTVLSGPAGGVVGAMETARRSGFRKILGFDMGGTSTDVSLADGAARETTEAYIDGFPIRVPMLDIHTVGAGGGSIARVDAGGLLRVGPESAGADPGPACYGSGTQPTVTDAHVVLGRIQSLLGGDMRIDADRAATAVGLVSQRLKVDLAAAAAGILRVANSNMERAIRVVSVERGYDPREFALVAFGGCGGLHAGEIAEQLGIHSVVVPQYAGALSALGMLMADAVRDYAAGVLGHDNFENIFEALEKRARRESRGARIERSADLRYRGQSYELNVPWTGVSSAYKAFHGEHARIYGYSLPKRDVEVVTIRVRARVTLAEPRIVRPTMRKGAAVLRRVWIAGSWRRVPVWDRQQLAKAPLRGPALVLDYGSTTLVPPGWSFHVDRAGNLLMEHKESRTVYTKSSHMKQKIRSTTILCVRRDGKVVMAGDGQVTLGSEVLKSSAKKLRRLYKDKILAGFAGSTADAFALFGRFEAKLEQHNGNLPRASVELAKEWRMDRSLRHLEALLLVADKENTYLLSGNGDVIEPDEAVAAIGSGGAYAKAAATALIENTKLSARDIVEKAMIIAGKICIYTNESVVFEELG